MRKKQSAKYLFDKESIYKIYKELINQGKKSDFKKWAEDLKVTFPKKTYKWPTGSCTDTQHH